MDRIHSHVYLASDSHSLLPEFPSALFAGCSVVQAQNAAQGENRYTEADGACCVVRSLGILPKSVRSTSLSLPHILVIACSETFAPPSSEDGQIVKHYNYVASYPLGHPTTDL